MKVLSLFDGMSCGMLAMMESKVLVDRYVAYEIDKYAIQTSQYNFPMIEQKGDVFTADFTQYEGFDFLIGGSPCTYWSIAQKNNRETEASGLGWELFSQYVRALREAKPKFFIYENNKSMAKAIRDSIRETFGFEEICINSALVSAQNRQRYYWVGKRNEDDTYSKVNILQPEDRGILLRDVLDNAYPAGETKSGKSFAFTANCANYNGGAYLSHTLEKSVKTNTLSTVLKDNPICKPLRVGCMPSPDGTIKGSQGNRIYSVDAKTVNQTANGGGAGAKTGLYAIPCKWDENGLPIKAISGADGKTYTVYPVKDGKITIKGKTYPIKLLDGYYVIRKLTIAECKRLQTVPNWFEFPVSSTQAYRQLGNGWTVSVISHLINGIMSEWLSEVIM